MTPLSITLKILSSLGRSISFSKDARRRYTKHFGKVNQEISLGGHNFILLDAPGLVEEDYQRHALSQSYDVWKPLPGGPVEFVKSMPAGKFPRCLAHIPCLDHLLHRLERPAIDIIYSHSSISSRYQIVWTASREGNSP